MERKCYACGTEIGECMGYLRAGDYLEFIDGKKESIREMCGRCVQGFDLFCGENNFPKTEKMFDIQIIRFRKNLVFRKDGTFYLSNLD